MFKHATLGYTLFIKQFLINRVIIEYNKIINEKTHDFMDFLGETCEDSFRHTYDKLFKKYKNENEIWHRIFNNKHILILFKYYYYLYYTLSVEREEYEYEYLEKMLHRKTARLSKQSLYEYIKENYSVCTFGTFTLDEFMRMFNDNSEFRKKIEDMHYKQETEKVLTANIIYETINTESVYTQYHIYYHEYKSMKNQHYFQPENFNASFINLVDLSMNVPVTIHTAAAASTYQSKSPIGKTMSDYINYLENHVHWLIEQTNNIC